MLRLESMLMYMILAATEGQIWVQTGALFMVYADARNHVEAFDPCSHEL